MVVLMSRCATHPSVLPVTCGRLHLVMCMQSLRLDVADGNAPAAFVTSAVICFVCRTCIAQGLSQARRPLQLTCTACLHAVVI